MSSKGFNVKVVEPYSFALTKAICFDFKKSDSSEFNVFTNVVQDVLDFLAVWNTCPDFKKYLSTGLYSSDAKKEFIKEYFGSTFHPILINFLNLLCDTKRIVYAEGIFTRFLEIVLKITNNFNVEIQIANNIFSQTSKIDGKLLFTLVQDLLEKNVPEKVSELYDDSYFSKLRVKFIIKEVPELLGGFRLNFPDQSLLMDFTIANRINQVSQLLN